MAGLRNAGSSLFEDSDARTSSFAPMGEDLALKQFGSGLASVNEWEKSAKELANSRADGVGIVRGPDVSWDALCQWSIAR